VTACNSYCNAHFCWQRCNIVFSKSWHCAGHKCAMCRKMAPGSRWLLECTGQQLFVTLQVSLRIDSCLRKETGCGTVPGRILIIKSLASIWHLCHRLLWCSTFAVTSTMQRFHFCKVSLQTVSSCCRIGSMHCVSKRSADYFTSKTGTKFGQNLQHALRGQMLCRLLCM